LTALNQALIGVLNDVETSEPNALQSAITLLAGAAVGIIDATTAAAVAAVLAEAAVVVVEVAAVAAAAAVLLTSACYIDVLAEAALDYAKAQFWRTLAQDPADPNFTVIALPATLSLSVQPLSTASGFSSQVVSDLNSLFSNVEEEIALLQVIPITINRVNGAAAAGNALWQAQQVQAAQKYAAQLIPLLRTELVLRAAITADLKSSGVVFTFSSTDSQNALRRLGKNGFPAGVTAALTQLGLDSTAQTTILQSALLTSPDVAAALGTGTFPQALSDPSFEAATNDAVIGLSELAAKIIFLIGSDAVSFHRDSAFASQLWAHLGANVAYINDFGVSGVTTVDGQPVTGFPSVPASLSGFSALFFASPGRCCNDPSTDTSLGITSNASAVASFLGGGGSVVIENFQGASPWDSILGFPSAPGVIYGTPFPGCSDPGVSTVAGVTAGFIGDAAGPNRYVDSCFVHEAYSDSFFSSHGFTSLIDAASLASGSGVLLEQGGLTPSTVATPVTTATTAVVEANANGDTVANLRGLASTDAPTLQDQIQMIVQFRVIQNPLTDVTQLTTQLVESLPSTILPPSQAAAIINAVAKQVVSPPDTIPPVTTVTPSPGPNANGWNNTNVTVTFNSTDNEPNGTGVKQLTITLSGAQSGSMVVPGVTASVQITTEGTTILTYFGTDNAGNQETAKTLTIKIDKTSPVISGMPAAGCMLWPPNHKFVQVATVTAADALSGLAPGSFRVTGASNEPIASTDPMSPDIIITQTAPSTFTVQLRAERLGTGTGRVYTLNASAGDLAGNAATSTATCTVPHDQGQ
jgi:hypothetical protein